MSATYDFDCECDNFEMLEDQDVFTMNEGIPGPGVPAGGSTGQILQKRSQEDYDTEWVTPDGYVPAGGSAGQILKKSSAADYDTEWDSLDAGDVSFDSSLTYADGSVGKEICDVKNTLNHKADIIYDTASGDIASFLDGADGLPVKDLTVGIEPVQDLHGYDNPWPAGGGKNKFYTTNVTESGTTVNGITFTRQTDGTVKAVGLSESTDFRVLLGSVALAAGTYTVSGAIDSTKRFRLVDGQDNLIAHESGSGATFTLETDQTVTLYIRLSEAVGTSINAMFKPMICLSSASNPTTFAPYSNICPISGWTGCNVTRTGKNLMSSIIEQGSIQSANGSNMNADDRVRTKDQILLPAGTYCISFSGLEKVYGFLYDTSGSFISKLSSGWESVPFSFTLSEERNVRFAFKMSDDSAATPSNISNVQLEFGSSATSYEAFVARTTLPISWQSSAGTVYGGTLDVTTGVLIRTMGMVDLGTLDYTYDGNGIFRIEAWQIGLKSPTQSNIPANALSSIYKVVATSYPTENLICKPHTNGRVYFVNTSYDNAAAFKTAMNGVQLCYELDQPQTYQLDPVTVNTLLGQNNIWSDTGSSTVGYPADTKLYIDKKLAALVAALS